MYSKDGYYFVTSDGYEDYSNYPASAMAEQAAKRYCRGRVFKRCDVTYAIVEGPRPKLGILNSVELMKLV